MEQCWDLDPKLRPSFLQLRKSFFEILAEHDTKDLYEDYDPAECLERVLKEESKEFEEPMGELNSIETNPSLSCVSDSEIMTDAVGYLALDV